MSGGLRVGRIFGIEIFIDGSWLVIAFLVGWSVYLELDQSFPRSGAAALWLLAAATSVLFFACVLAHELSHSVVANRRGLDVHRIRLFIFGGVSELTREAPTPADEFAITIAGPLTSFLLGAGLWAVSLVTPSGNETTYALRLLAFTNLILGVFNLLPGFPLDGGRVLRSIVWRVTGDRSKATRAAVWGGRTVAALLIASGLAVVLVAGQLTGLWSVAIGWFLLQAANSSLRRLEIEDTLAGVEVAGVMTPDPVTVDGGLTLQQLFDDFVMTRNHSAYPVVEGGLLVGLIDLGRLRSVARPGWETTRVREVMHPLTETDAVGPATPVSTLMGRLAGGERRIVVVENGAPVGILAAVDVAHWLHRAGL